MLDVLSKAVCGLSAHDWLDSSLPPLVRRKQAELIDEDRCREVLHAIDALAEGVFVSPLCRAPRWLNVQKLVIPVPSRGVPIATSNERSHRSRAKRPESTGNGRSHHGPFRRSIWRWTLGRRWPSRDGRPVDWAFVLRTCFREPHIAMTLRSPRASTSVIRLAGRKWDSALVRCAGTI